MLCSFSLDHWLSNHWLRSADPSQNSFLLNRKSKRNIPEDGLSLWIRSSPLFTSLAGKETGTTNDERRRTTNDQRPATNDDERRPTTNDQRRTTNDQRRPTTNDMGEKRKFHQIFIGGKQSIARRREEWMTSRDDPLFDLNRSLGFIVTVI